MVALAAAQGRAVNTRQIARLTRVPRDYLAKLLQALVRAGLARSHRGIRGGFVMARPAADVTMLDCVRAVARSRRIVACPLGLGVHRHELCPLHRRLDEAMALAEDTFRRTTVAQLLREGGGIPLCAESRSPRPSRAASARRNAAKPAR